MRGCNRVAVGNLWAFKTVEDIRVDATPVYEDCWRCVGRCCGSRTTFSVAREAEARKGFSNSNALGKW